MNPSFLFSLFPFMCFISIHCIFWFFCFFPIVVQVIQISRCLCLLSLSSGSHWPINSGKKGPDAFTSSCVSTCVSTCVCVCACGRFEEGWTCRKHNQPDDKMSNHPTGFRDLLVREIEGEEITARLRTSSFSFVCLFKHWFTCTFSDPKYFPSFPRRFTLTCTCYLKL